MKFEKMSLEETAGILEWAIIMNEGILPIKKYVLDLYPKLNTINTWENFSSEKRKKIIKSLIQEDYIKEQERMKQIVSNYENIWNKYDKKFVNSIKKVLNIDFSNNLITVKVGKIPVYPRDISENCFYIGEMKDNYFVETVMHEYCHFIYFEKWKELFNNWKAEEFESPHIIWYLSEMVIDPILNNAEIQKVYKYKFRAYENFYKININGNNLMKTISEIYSKNTIEEAMIKTYEYVLKNEKFIK